MINKNGPMLGLRTATYKVPDLKAGKEWYTEAFGVDPYFDQPYYVGFNIGGFELGLLPEDDGPATRGDSQLTYWGVEEIQKEYDRLLSLGAVAHEEPVGVGGELMVATVKDPWGNLVGLIYNPEFTLE